VAAAALLLLSACGSEPTADPASEPPSSATPTADAAAQRADKDQDRVAQREPVRNIVVQQGAAADLSEQLPQDVPAYPNAMPDRAIRRANGRVVARFVTSDAPNAVQSFYAEKLAAAGWSISQQSSSGGLTMLRGRKNSRLVSVMIPGAEAKSETRVTVVASG
jgi:hypothetical protein